MISHLARATACAVLICVSSPSHAGDDALHDYVRRAAQDPGVFVYNPPVELQAYAHLSQEELQAKQSAALESGSLLILFPSGLPMKLESHSNSLPHGEFKTWYADGTLQSAETFTDEKLMQGKYFAPDGKLISEVKNGNGKRVEFELKEDGQTFTPRTETEYVDGLKDGKETSLSSSGDKSISGETHYRKGLKHGPNQAWASNGQITAQENYFDGQKHGMATFWHDNGNPLFTTQYDHGQQVGMTSRYARNGQKIEETLRSGKDVLVEMLWYPEGAMMVCKKYDPVTHKMVEAQSFDRSGQVNGSVQDGRGKLVVCENLNGYLDDAESFALEQYVGGNTPNRIALPTLQLNSVQREKDTMKFRFRTDKIPGIDELSARLEPVVPGTEPVTVELKAINKKKTVPPTVFPVPGEASNWSGTIYAQCTAKGKLGTYSFIQIVFSAEK